MKPAPAEIVQPAAPESEDALSDIHPNGGAHATPAVAPSRGPEEAEAPVAPTKDARSEMLEDYSLRYAPHSYRKWTEFQVANTAGRHRLPRRLRDRRVARRDVRLHERLLGDPARRDRDLPDIVSDRLLLSEVLD